MGARLRRGVRGSVRGPGFWDEEHPPSPPLPCPPISRKIWDFPQMRYESLHGRQLTHIMFSARSTPRSGGWGTSEARKADRRRRNGKQQHKPLILPGPGAKPGLRARNPGIVIARCKALVPNFGGLVILYRSRFCDER